MQNKIYYSAADIAGMLDISIASAYRIIKKLNAELDSRGYLTLPGKVSVIYFHEKFYGMALERA